MSNNRDLTITLKIMSLRVPVTEQMPVIVIWSRQTKQAKTKKRLLMPNSDTTVFDEPFQITTSMACDDDGKPTKSKMVSPNQEFIRHHINMEPLCCVVSTHGR